MNAKMRSGKGLKRIERRNAVKSMNDKEDSL
jgi:hypothetical protein